MSGGFVEIPVDTPLDHELAGSPNAPESAAPAPQQDQQPRPKMWTAEQERAIVDRLRSAKSPEEFKAFVDELGKPNGVTIPMDGPGGVHDLFGQRERGSITRQFAIPDFLKGQVKPDQVPDGMTELPADAQIDYGTLSGLSPDEIKAKYESHPAAEMVRRAIEQAGPLGLSPLQMHGYTVGLDTEVGGVGSAAGEFLLHPLRAIGSGGASVADAYHDARTESLARIDYLHMLRDQQYGKWEAPVEEISGALANPIGMRAAATKYLPLAAAAYGGVSGFENTNGSPTARLEESAKDAAISAVAAPVAGAVLRVPGAAIRAGRSVMEGSPDLARRIITRAIDADGKTAAEAGGEMSAAHTNDVPMMLADTGENTRGLLAAATRAPGPGRTVARTALEQRQGELADRVTRVIERDLGPVTNPHEVADQLMTEASTRAGPLYDAAYARPGADTFARKIAPLLNRPSMQRAFQNAYRIAKEEGRDPTTLGFDINDAGEVTVTPTPSWQTLDYVKRGMDDVVESYRDSTTGRLKLNTEGKAINNTLRSYLAAFDAANPEYAAARAAYGGPVSGINAMNAGRKSLKLTADDLEARMRDLTPFQKQMYALGARRAMAEAVDGKGDTANVINALIGTGKKRAMLARLFGDRQQFGRFADTLIQEREGFKTFARATQGSPTALNLNDDTALSAAEPVVDAVANGGLPIGTALKLLQRYGRGALNRKTMQQVATLLSETDPLRLKNMADVMRAEVERRGLRSRRINRAAIAATRAAVVAANQPSQ